MAAGAIAQAAASDIPTACHEAATTGHRAAPHLALFSQPIFFYLLLFLGTSLGTNRGSVGVILALKTPLGRNKAVRLGLFWIQALRLHLFQSIYAKFLFLFFFFITCLLIFLFLKSVDLVYV